MFENIINFFKSIGKKEKANESSGTAKERLHLVLMQDRANVSADFLELMKQEIIEVIKKYIDIDEKAIDVRLTNKTNDDGTVGAPALYANIPIVTIKNEARKANVPHNNGKDVENMSKETETKKVIKEDKTKNDEENKAKSNNLNESNVELANEDINENKKQDKNSNEQESKKQGEEQEAKQKQQVDISQTQNAEAVTNIENKEKHIVNESEETKEILKGEEERIKNENGEQT